jgi:seryl-tRNA synthetase
MLDLADFITDRGGDPNKIKESQRRRSAPESDVDEVISLYEEARRGKTCFLCFLLDLVGPVDGVR